MKPSFVHGKKIRKKKALRLLSFGQLLRMNFVACAQVWVCCMSSSHKAKTRVGELQPEAWRCDIISVFV